MLSKSVGYESWRLVIHVFVCGEVGHNLEMPVFLIAKQSFSTVGGFLGENRWIFYTNRGNECIGTSLTGIVCIQMG
jgi:hypothetical protein